MNNLEAVGGVVQSIRAWLPFVVSRPWLRRIEALFTSLLAYLAVTPLVSRVLGRDTAAGQFAVLSHDVVGSVLLVLLPLFLLIHLVGRSGVRPRALEVWLFCLKRVGFGALVFMALLFSQLSRALGVGLLLIAVGTFEWAARDRPRAARLADVALTGLCIAFLITALDHTIKGAPVIALILLVECEAIAFVRRVRRQEEAMSRWGALSIAFAVAMLPFSFVLHLSPTLGAYGLPFSPFVILHVATTTGFVVAFVVHIRSAAKEMAAARRPSNVFSLPTFVVGLVAITGWQLGFLTALRRYHAPPARIDTATAKATRVSPYTQVEGYVQSQWDERLLQPAMSCGRSQCHAEITEQHELSAHGRAFTNDIFQFQLAQFIAEKGRAAADYCIGCHAPLAVIAHPGGTLDVASLDATTSEPSFAAGVSCLACHRSTPEKDRDRVGNVSLTIRPLGLEDNRYFGEDDPADDVLHRRLIKLATELHRQTYRIDRRDINAVCAACHVYVLPGNVSVDGRSHLVSDEYLSFVDSPYARAGLTCASCHQPGFLNYEDGYPIVDHYYLGSGSSLPYRDTSDDQRLRAVSINFLQGLGDVALEPNVPAALPACVGSLSAPLAQPADLRERAPEGRFDSPNRRRDLLRVAIDSVETVGDALKVQISTSNECVGHVFPSGGGIKAYFDARAFDSSGLIAGRYGGLGPDGEPVETPTRLGTQIVDSTGKPIADGRFWAATSVSYRKELLPGEAVRDEIWLPITRGKHAARIEGTWYYLRPERFRNRERGIQRDIPPVAIGTAEWRAESVR